MVPNNAKRLLALCANQALARAGASISGIVCHVMPRRPAETPNFAAMGVGRELVLLVQRGHSLQFAQLF